jgi:tRNA dimethylallyltransferase
VNIYFRYLYIVMIHHKPPPMIVITGPTATGKTRLAAQVAAKSNGEIISADSRQVFRGMDFGTGKDYGDYLVNDYLVPYHLVDIVDPGHEYSVFEFQQDFLRAYHHIVKRHKQAVLCGGTGLYIEAALKGYHLRRVPENHELRKKLEKFTWEELTGKLEAMRPLHNTTDTKNRERLVRAIEIETFNREQPSGYESYPKISYKVFCIELDRDEIRKRITTRLKNRLERGMVEEINKLLKTGIKPDQLMFYGLEYRYLTLYSIGEINYDQMFEKLNTAIHQFAKRQMTWFRRMEKRGIPIRWLNGHLPMEEKVETILKEAEKA